MKTLATTALLAVLNPVAPGVAAAQEGAARDLRVRPGGDERSGPLGLRARFDRPKPVYLPGETLALTISTDREARIEIWEVGSNGALSPLLAGVPLHAGPDRPLRLPMRGQRFEVGDEAGSSELLIVARAVAPPARSLAEAAADPSRPGSSNRQEVRLRYTVVHR